MGRVNEPIRIALGPADAHRDLPKDFVLVAPCPMFPRSRNSRPNSVVSTPMPIEFLHGRPLNAEELELPPEHE
jgi:hypothetical protein